MSLVGMGFDSEHDFAPTTVLSGLLFALALVFFWGGGDPTVNNFM